MKNKANLHYMQPEAAAYIAGLIDGQGAVTLSKHHVIENGQLVVCHFERSEPPSQNRFFHVDPATTRRMTNERLHMMTHGLSCRSARSEAQSQNPCLDKAPSLGYYYE